MKRRGTGTLAVVLALTPALVAAADWSAQTGVQLSLAAESNPRMLVEQRQSARASVADLSLDLVRSTELLDLGLRASASVFRYSGVTDLNRRDQRLALDLSRQGEWYTVGGNAFLTRDTTLTSELGTTGITQYDLRHRARGISIGPRWQLNEVFSTGMTLGWQDSSYERSQQSGLSDHHYSYVSLVNRFNSSETTLASLLISVGRLDSAVYTYDTYSTDVRMQIEHSWSPRWKGSISGGPSRVRADRRRASGSVFGASLSRQAERLSFDASLERSTAPSGSGALSRRDEAALHVGGVVLEHLSVSASVSMVRSRDLAPQPGSAVNAVRYLRTELSLSYSLARDWNLGLIANHARQKLLSSGADGLNTGVRVQFAWHPTLG